MAANCVNLHKRLWCMQTPYDELFQVDDESQQLYDPKKRCSVLRLPVVGMFYTERGDLYAPTALRMFVSRMGAIPNVCVLVTIRQVCLRKCSTA